MEDMKQLDYLLALLLVLQASISALGAVGYGSVGSAKCRAKASKQHHSPSLIIYVITLFFRTKLPSYRLLDAQG